MIELIFVILILGIVASVGSEILMRTYENYVIQQTVAQLQSRTKYALEFITGHLERAILPSVANFNASPPTGTDAYEGIASVDWIEGNCSSNNAPKLVWIGKDVESLQGEWNGTMLMPGCSGMLDMVQSKGTTLFCIDSNLSDANTTQGDITGWPDWTDPSNNTYRSALYFVHANSAGSVENRFWVNPSSLFPVSNATWEHNSTISLLTPPEEIGEKFYLSYTAYAIEHNGTGLQLRWNWRPWNEENPNSGNNVFGIADNVTEFTYWGESGGGLIRLRLCMEFDSAVAGKIEFCKESAVLR